MNLIQAIFFLLLLLAGNVACAQQFKLNKANRLFDDFRFTEAVVLYKEVNAAHPDNIEAKIKLAESYRLLNNTVEAEKWYSVVVQLVDSIDAYKLHYAQVLMSNEKYEEAAAWLEEYIAANATDRRARNLLEGIEQIYLFLIDSSLYSVEKMPFNTKYADFAPVPYKEGLCFTSTATTQPGNLDSWAGGHPALNLVYASELDNGLWTSPVALTGELNGPWHEGPAIFTSDFNKVYVTRQNYEAIDDVNTVRLKLYEAHKGGEEEWGELIPLPFNSDAYSAGHPAITQDGKTLYFSSDMEGGFGGLDLYKSEWSVYGWSAPVNLGRKVNTEGDESFPHVFRDSLLLFASNGHPGLGGLDIYHTPVHNLQQPGNFGAPINSSKDDFGILVQQVSPISGYFSSNRGNDPHDDNIYYFNLQQAWLTIRFFDQQSYKPVDSVQITLNGDEQMSYHANPYRLQIDTGVNYRFLFRKDGFISADTNFIIPDLTETAHLMFVYLKERPKLQLTGAVIDSLQQQPVAGAKVSMYVNGKFEQEIVTGADGTYSFPLDGPAEYVLMADKYGYFLLQPDTVKIQAGEESPVAGTDLYMLKMKKDAVIRLDNIYYDLDKYTLREQAALELDKLIKLLKQYPDMTIELGSHTDSRASSNYNQWLSARRAAIAVQYIISKGISPSRVTGKGYGESAPVNRCRDGVPCTEKEYQANRRTEFKVINPPRDTEVFN